MQRTAQVGVAMSTIVVISASHWRCNASKERYRFHCIKNMCHQLISSNKLTIYNTNLISLTNHVDTGTVAVSKTVRTVDSKFIDGELPIIIKPL